MEDEKPPTEQFSSAPMTSDENRRLRQLLRDDDRAHWFWTTVRTWIMWFGGIAIALLALKDTLRSFLRGAGL